MRWVEIMLNNISRTAVVAGAWLVALVVLIGASVAMGATPSTTGLLLVLAVAPAVIMVLIGAGAPSPTVAEILHAVHAKDGR